MATTAAETSGASGAKPDAESGATSASRRRERRRTTLDEHVDRPSTMEPGDAPFDTTDPFERAVSVSPDKAAAARAGHGTVNAVVPMVQPEREEKPDRKDRTEKYKARTPDGKLVSVEHNLETGETKVS